MQPVVVRGFAELRNAGITRTGYELYGLLLHMCSALSFQLSTIPVTTHHTNLCIASTYFPLCACEVVIGVILNLTVPALHQVSVVTR